MVAADHAENLHDQRGALVGFLIRHFAVAASVRKMSNQEADECAALIVEIFGLMCRVHVAPSRPNTVVQLHSVDCPPADYEVPALIAAN